MSLEISHLTCKRGYNTLFTDLSFTVEPGQVLVVEGKNGCGKSTLLRVVAGLRQADNGEVLWQQQPIAKSKRYHQDMNWLSHRNGVNENLTAKQNLEGFAALSHQAMPDYMLVLDLVGLTGMAHTLVKHFSAGMKKRLALTRLLLKSAPLWLLDEPQAALDKAGMQMLSQMIDNHLANGGMVVMTSHHDVQLANSQVTTLNLMKGMLSNAA